jgi:hypothetical protein
MSEERMIRVAMEDEDVVLGFLTIADKWGHTRVVDIELEPVAPKDWRPLCYQAQTPHPLIDEGVIEKVEGCGYGYYHQNAHGSCEPNYGCWECPYRKKRE